MRRKQFIELPRLPSLPRLCSYSKTLKTLVHRFALGERTCLCGDVTVEEPPERVWGPRSWELAKAVKRGG